jgi:uncharacterized membrane protein YcaP (DUF421 family)
MEIVVRAAALYAFVLLLFRAAGKRTLAQTTVFDLVLLFIIGEMAEPAILGGDSSFTGGALAIVTLVALDVSLSLAKQRSPAVNRFVDGVPVAIVRGGRPDREAMDRERVDEEDVLAAARQTRGLARMDEIGEAVLERNGQISVLPR